MRRLLALAVWLLPATAAANGAYTHVHMSQLAHEMLAPGELRELLDTERPALEAGSMFPDSGYAVSDEYGELAHWERFLDAYVRYLRDTYAGDYRSAEARAHVAFLLGVASHGMADQSYDTTLLARAFEVDGPEDAEHPVDQYADYFLVIDHEVAFRVPAFAPYESLPAVIRDASGGHEVSPSTLMDAMRRMETLTGVQSDARIAGGLYWDAWGSYPFLGTHVYNPRAVGSVTWTAGLIAEYWRVVWARLRGADAPDADLVIRTVPEDGGANWPVDRSESEAWGRVAIWFGYGVDRDQITPLVTMTDDAASPVPIRFETAYGGRERNLLFVVPEAPLRHDTVYTVEIGAGVETISGAVTGAPALFSFRTRCADDRLEDCPPLEPPLVTGPIPERLPARPRVDGGPGDAGASPAPAGGCAAWPSRSSPHLALLLPLLLVLRRTR